MRAKPPSRTRLCSTREQKSSTFGVHEQGFERQLDGEGVPLQAVEGEQFLGHAGGSSGAGGGQIGRRQPGGGVVGHELAQQRRDALGRAAAGAGAGRGRRLQAPAVAVGIRALVEGIQGGEERLRCGGRRVRPGADPSGRSGRGAGRDGGSGWGPRSAGPPGRSCRRCAAGCARPRRERRGGASRCWGWGGRPRGRPGSARAGSTPSSAWRWR